MGQPLACETIRAVHSSCSFSLILMLGQNSELKIVKDEPFPCEQKVGQVIWPSLYIKKTQNNIQRIQELNVRILKCRKSSKIGLDIYQVSGGARK